MQCTYVAKVKVKYSNELSSDAYQLHTTYIPFQLSAVHYTDTNKTFEKEKLVPSFNRIIYSNKTVSMWHYNITYTISKNVIVGWLHRVYNQL